MRSSRAPRGFVLWALFLLGLGIRWMARGSTTADSFQYLLPWYDYAQQHGFASLAVGFTNYTPIYTYALLAITRLHGLAAPLTLIKSISVPFEFGCAGLVYLIVCDLSGDPRRAAAAFAACWLAPTVLLNGALWGQAESLWGFFTLLGIWLFLRGGNGVPAFATAFATKFQGAFLGPVVLGLVLRRRVAWPWLAAIPVVYVGLAAPVLLAGRPIAEVLTVYLHQAETFDRLSMNAANIWAFLPLPYALGVAVGLALATFTGLALAAHLARQENPSPELLLKFACASLLLMPLLLPKMHDRYFYGYELAVLALAFVDLRYLPLAAAAQISGVLAYMIWGGGTGRTVLPLIPAALLNLASAWVLLSELWRSAPALSPARRRAWMMCLAPAGGLIFASVLLPAQGWLLVILSVLTCAGYVDLIRESAARVPRLVEGMQLPPLQVPAVGDQREEL